MAANVAVAFYEPGADITGHCSAAVTGKRCLKISGNRQSTRAVSDATEGGNIVVAPADAAGRIVGVAEYDAASGGKVTVKRGPGIVLPIAAGAAIAAFEEVEVGATGKVVPLDAGVPVGFALTAAANNTDAEICLY